MTSAPKTRESLILRLPYASDVEAWQEFAAIYEPLIYGFGRQRGLQDADARELVQDVLLAVAKSINSWEPDPQRGKFRSWLYRIAKHKLINRFRRTTQPDASGRTSAMLQLQQLADDSDLEELELDYRRELFHAAAAFVRGQVEKTTWEAFWMTFVEEQPVDRVALELDMTRGAVYIARSRVVHRLKQFVSELEANDER